MALTRDDKQEIAEMIARAGLAMALNPGAFDPDLVVETVKEPDEHRFLRITGVRIRTLAPAVSEDGRSQIASVTGQWTHGSVYMAGLISFFFPPNEPAHLDELKRVQDHRLLEGMSIWFLKDPESGHYMITKVAIQWPDQMVVPAGPPPGWP